MTSRESHGERPRAHAVTVRPLRKRMADAINHINYAINNRLPSLQLLNIQQGICICMSVLNKLNI